MKKIKLFNKLTQIALPLMTIAAQGLFALKLPEWGFLLNLVTQPFWLYSGWKSYKLAGQVGFFITTIAIAIITVFGSISYWIVK